MKLTSELAELIGAFIGDGWMSKTKRSNRNDCIYSIGWSGDAKLDLDYFQNVLIPIIRKYFPNVKPHIYFHSTTNSINLKVYFREFYDFFESLGFQPGSKSCTVKIPEVFYKKDFLCYILRGIFDTDCCVFLDTRKCYKNPYPRIRLQMSSKSLMLQLKQYFETKGYSIYFKNIFRLNRAESFTLEIYGFKQTDRFLKEIGFSNTRHLSKLALVAKS